MMISEKYSEVLRSVGMAVLLCAIAFSISCSSAVVTETTKKIDTVLNGDILSPSHAVTLSEKIIIRNTLSASKKEIQIAVYDKQIQERKADRYAKWAWVGMIGAGVLGLILLGGIISGVIKFLHFIHVIP